MACIRTQINENDLWEVRKITREEGEVIEIMTQAMVPPSVQYRVVAVTSGGEEFVGHTKRDHINFGGDASTLVNFLNKRQTEDPGFFYRIEFGEGGRLCHLFWRDSMMKEDYLLYHDVHDRIFQQAFNKCLNGCYSEAEFEDTWGTMVEEYAGILSSQRSESTNHALGFQASKTTSLTEFYHIFEEMVKRWRPEEERNEFNSIRSRPTSIYPMVDLLDHAAQVYTLALFRVFENEFATAMGTRAVECGTYGSTLSYIVHSSACSEIPHHVSFDCDNLLIECTCRKFQEMRMLCYHSIQILHIRSISEILDCYILKRWTKFAKKDVWDRLLPNDRRKASINDAINWRRETLTNFNNLITKCLNVPESRVILDKAYATAHESVHALSTSTNVECLTTSSTQTTNQILDPKRSITKGRSRRKKKWHHKEEHKRG
ncbi:hypothetical protein RND81_14G140100 [Saponaria officinalis]|uniref:SWIM-type domain-containing protein n=1 Tax=Saponaria officinalis TaxID=3572 RepID=A0AAW1GS39_SAPOF